MGMLAAAAASALLVSPQALAGRRRLSGAWTLRLRPASPAAGALRLQNFAPRCYIANVEVDVSTVNKEEAFDDRPSLPSGCSIPVVNLRGDVLDSSPFLLHDRASCPSDFEELPVLSEGEQHTLASTPAHPAGLYAFSVHWGSNSWKTYGSFPSDTHVHSIECCAGGHSIDISCDGHLCFKKPEPCFYDSCGSETLVHCTSCSWSYRKACWIGTRSCHGARLGCVGTNRPVALAQANAVLNRLDLLCETVGASVFGLLLSKYHPVTCLKIASGLMICSFPVLVLLGQLINRVSCHALDSSRTAVDESICIDLLDVRKIAQNSLSAIKHGWREYKQQTVLPASAATVFLNFNVALAPGAIMTALLMHRGISPSIVGAFSGLCSIMGLVATFISSSLVKRVGILKAGAAGLIFQASLLSVALAVYWAGSISHKTPLFIFLASIALSRLGHMSYDVVGTQIVQTGVPASKANLIGGMEVSIGSLAELVMLAMAIIANDVSHFGFLAILSVSSVAGAAWMFCRWLTNPTDEQRELFMFDPVF